MFLTKALLSSVIIPLSLMTGLSVSPTVTNQDTENLLIYERTDATDIEYAVSEWDTTLQGFITESDFNRYIIYKHSIYIEFADYHKHSGRITYNQSISNRVPHIENPDKVMLTNRFLYFYDVQSICIYYYEIKYHDGGQSYAPDSNYVNVTVNNFQESTYDKTLNDVYDVIETMSGTVTDIKTNTDTIIDKLLDLIDGTTSSQNAADDLDDKTTDLSSSIGSLETIESSAVDDMTDALGNIDVNTSQGIILLPQFTNAATWVKQQFDWITNIKPNPNDASTKPFGMLLTYSLVLGLGLFIIGRLK